VFRGGSPASGIAAITGGQIRLDDGTLASPAYSFASATGTGMHRNTASNRLVLGLAGAEAIGFFTALSFLPSTGRYAWTDGTVISGTIDTALGRTSAGLVEVNNGTLGTLAAIKANYFQSSTPNTQTGTTYTVAATDSNLIINGSATCTLTLPAAAAANAGRTIRVRTIAAFTVVSASSNVVPLAGGSAGTAILAATAGKWADLTSDGTNWQIMASN
jgi:hypothetical protein